MGEILKKETTELLTLIYRANSKTDKHATLQVARERIEVIRLFISLMKDLQQISTKRFIQVNQKVEDVSKQLQVGISYKRLHCLRMPVRQTEWLLLQPFRQVTAIHPVGLSR